MKREMVIMKMIVIAGFLLTTAATSFADMQGQRKELINRLIEKKIFTKVSKPGDLPRVYVGPAFHGLTFDNKQLFVSVVYAYFYDCKTKTCKDKPKGLVVVYDGMNNKRIGAFSLGLYGNPPGLVLY